LLRVFAWIDGTPKASPVVRVKDVGKRVAQLHDVATVLKLQDPCDSVGRMKRPTRSQEELGVQNPRRRYSQARST
jgi:hypothetical protein